MSGLDISSASAKPPNRKSDRADEDKSQPPSAQTSQSVSARSTHPSRTKATVRPSNILSKTPTSVSANSLAASKTIRAQVKAEERRKEKEVKAEEKRREKEAKAEEKARDKEAKAEARAKMKADKAASKGRGKGKGKSNPRFDSPAPPSDLNEGDVPEPRVGNEQQHDDTRVNALDAQPGEIQDMQVDTAGTTEGGAPSQDVDMDTEEPFAGTPPGTASPNASQGRSPSNKSMHSVNDGARLLTLHVITYSRVNPKGERVSTPPPPPLSHDQTGKCRSLCTILH